MIEKNIFFFSEDLIRDQKTRTVFGFEKQNISVEEFTQKISLSLSFSLFLWFWAFRETQQCTCSHDKQSASLYIRQDSIDMSAFTHSSTCTLHSAVAIGISCTQSLGVDFSPATPRGALVGIVCIVCRVHARTVREKTRTGKGGRAHRSIQGRQHDHQYHEHQSPHHL